MTPKSRLGKKDSIFQATTPTRTAPAPKKAGPKAAPPVEDAPSSSVDNKLTVILPPDQVAFLDRLALDIRSAAGPKGWKTRRTEIIRALVAGLMTSGADLTSCRSEEELAAMVAERLKTDLIT